MHRSTLIPVLFTFAFDACRAFSINVNSQSSVATAAEALAENIVKTYYHGNESGHVPGIFGTGTTAVTDVFFYQSGYAWNQLVDYWALTGDDRYNSIVTQALVFQSGEAQNYEPQNQTLNLGNDDQAFWALAALTAAERGLPNATDGPAWITLAQTVFDRQVTRWQVRSCGGGLRWQIFPFNNGYDYKSSITQGAFFQLAARLYRFTGNTTYSDWAEKTFTWMQNATLIDNNWNVLDGVQVSQCSQPSPLRWTVNNGLLLGGSAIMFNMTNGSSSWRSRTEGLLGASSSFIHKQTGNDSSVLTEPPCETVMTCKSDQSMFKGVYAQQLGITAVSDPSLLDRILGILNPTAEVLGSVCTGGNSGNGCGTAWYLGRFQAPSTLGADMSALAVTLALLQAQGVGSLRNQSGLAVDGGAAALNETSGDADIEDMGGDGNVATSLTICSPLALIVLVIGAMNFLEIGI